MSLLSKQELKTRSRLIELMKAHDWTHEFADDQNAWAAGIGQRSRIESVCNQLPRILVIELWEAYAPKKPFTDGREFFWGPPKGRD